MKKSEFLKIIIFIFIGIILFGCLSVLLIPKKYIREDDVYGFNDQMSDFYSQEENTIDVIFLGTSHSNLALSPMDMYRDYGFTSYNLATSSQSIETSELLLKEAIKHQKPSVVTFDVAALFYDKSEYDKMTFNKNYRAIMGVNDYVGRFPYLVKMCPDNMPLLEYISPMYRFHGRWDKLVSDDFLSYSNEYPDYLMGFFFSEKVKPWYGEITTEAEDMRAYINSKYKKTEEDLAEELRMKSAHSDKFGETSMKIFENIRAICEENNVRLICVKAPTAIYWSYEKSEATRKYMAEQGIDYVDFAFGDTGVTYDWYEDTCDKGLHVNYVGAKKTTEYLGKYLSQLNILTDHRGDPAYRIWDEKYEEYAEFVSEKMMTDEEKSYKFLADLSEDMDGKVIMISVLDDVGYGWNENWVPFF